MKKSYLDVREFHSRFNHPVSDRPTYMRPARREFRHALLEEEVNEFLEADTVADQVDAMIDTIYIALGTLVELGVDPEPVFAIVHGANMSKLGDDGKPLYHPNGKVRKPDGWTPPEPKIIAEVARQSAQAERREDAAFLSKHGE